MLIAPKMECYQQLIQKAKQGKVEFEVAIEHSEDLQPRLMRFFRSSALLFHPDKSDKNEELRCLKTELFKEFNQFAENSREILREGLETLKKCIPKLESKYQAILDQMQRDREESGARSEELIRAHTQKQAQAQVEMYAEIARTEEKIERLDNLLIENGMMSPNPMPEEERPGSSLDFFTRPSP
jgi:pyruvate-formate lyase